jgi:hypothetical protein
MQVPPQSICVPGHEIWQVPFAQTFPLLHAAPALPAPPAPHAPVAPQLVLLESGSTHVPPQSISFAGHDTWQTPFAQTLPFAQATPALPPASPVPQPEVAPQYWRLEVGSMQIPPHSTRLAWQESWQVPFEQTLPALHGVPHAPQFAGSTWRLAQ